MHLDLTDEQAALLIAALDRIIDGDRYPLSRRFRALREMMRERKRKFACAFTKFF